MNCGSVLLTDDSLSSRHGYDTLYNTTYITALYSSEYNPGLRALRSKKFSANYDVSKTCERMRDHSVRGFVRGLKDYPVPLSCIISPPYIVYAWGRIELLSYPCLSIVGPRMYTAYAERVVKDCVSLMEGSEWVVVSGMASGVDTIAHESAMRHNLPTVAVLGEGIGRAIAGSKAATLRSIVDTGGLVLSEFPLFMRATNYTFPQRNRIIAGIPKSVFVPEAAEGSGTMITVRSAIQQSTPVYATSHHIYRQASRGIMDCIGKGDVRVVTNIEHFIQQDLGITQKVKESVPSCLSTNAQMLLAYIKKQPEAVSVQNLANGLEWKSGEVLRELSHLELSGHVSCNNQGLWEVC